MKIGEELFRKLDHIDKKLIYDEIKDSNAFDELLEEEGVGEGFRKEYVLDHLDGRRQDLHYELFANAGESNGRLLVYRCINVPDPEAFLMSVVSGKAPEERPGLGIYWAWDIRSARCYCPDLEGGADLRLTGEVPFESIDFETTAIRNFMPIMGDDEREIRIPKGFPVWLTEVHFLGDSGGGQLLHKFKSPKEFRA